MCLCDWTDLTLPIHCLEMTCYELVLYLSTKLKLNLSNLITVMCLN